MVLFCGDSLRSRARCEQYPLADYRDVTELLGQGRPYLTTLDDDDIDPAVESLLRRLNKYSELAVPVMYEEAMWGELWATGADGRCFGPDDVRLLQAIAAQISVAIGTSELFSEVSRYAYQDPLTGLANRRRLDECLRELGDDEGDPTLLVCDLDGFKEVNDREGHTAGDALLRGVASGSDPAEVKVLHELGYRAVLAVGIVDGQHGYLMEIYSDSDHTELIAVAPHVRVLAHYCVRNVPAGSNSTRPA